MKINNALGMVRDVHESAKPKTFEVFLETPGVEACGFTMSAKNMAHFAIQLQVKKERSTYQAYKDNLILYRAFVTLAVQLYIYIYIFF